MRALMMAAALAVTGASADALTVYDFHYDGAALVRQDGIPDVFPGLDLRLNVTIPDETSPLAFVSLDLDDGVWTFDLTGDGFTDLEGDASFLPSPSPIREDFVFYSGWYGSGYLRLDADGSVADFEIDVRNTFFPSTNGEFYSLGSGQPDYWRVLGLPFQAPGHNWDVEIARPVPIPATAPLGSTSISKA